MTSIRRGLCGLGVSLLMLAVPPSWASGGDGGYMENAFMPEYHVVAADLPAYASGQLGIVPGSYWRIYLFLAYRALNAQPLSKEELAALGINGWKLGVMADRWDQNYDEAANGVGAWRAARQRIPGVAEVKIDVQGGADAYVSFLNCPTDALRRATQTLDERLAKWGPSLTAEWLKGQDAVFSNCSAQTGSQNKYAGVLPPALPKDAPAWLVWDRDYQTAAALFYAGHYDQARTRFLAIAETSHSPWQGLGAYLAARCLLRQATLMVPAGGLGAPENDQEKAARTGLLSRARNELVALGKTDPAAARLVGWVDARLRPEARLEELAASLQRGRIDQQGIANLADYLRISDGLNRDQLMAAQAPMTFWIAAMQADWDDDIYQWDATKRAARHPQGMALIRQRWAAQHDPLWLMPLLSNARPGELQEAELKAAAAVPPSSLAYPSLQYHLARLAIQVGQHAQAERIVAAALKTGGMSVATRNRWRQLQMITARTVEDFLAAAPREWAERNTGVPIPNESTTSPTPDLATMGHDADLEIRLSRDFTLAQLKVLRLHKALQPRRDYLDDMVWTRAVALEDYATADEVTDDLARRRSSTRHLYVRFKAAQGPEAKRLAAALILVNSPELGLNLIEPGGGFRDWGCANTNPNASVGAESLDFLPLALTRAEDRAQITREQQRLLSLPLRTEYLAPTLIEWAKQKPADPEAPKALHFLVASTRLECPWTPTDAQGKPLKRPQYSKEAFQILHKLYPKNEWTAKTPYYF